MTLRRTQPLPRPLALALTLGDQAAVSLTAFVTSVLVVRATENRAEEALFFLAVNLWMWAGEAQNALISFPHSLRLPKLDDARRPRLNGSMLLLHGGFSVVALIVLLAGALAAKVTATPADALMIALAAVTAMPILLRQFARYYAFASLDSLGAFSLDAMASFLQIGSLVALFLTGQLTWITALLASAGANAIAVALWMVVYRSSFVLELRGAWVELLRSWPASRWIFLSSMTWYTGTFAYPWVIRFASGKEQAAIWGICFSVAALANPLLGAIQNHVGPSIAHAHAKRPPDAFRRFVWTMSGVCALVMLGPALVVGLFAGTLLDLVYADPTLRSHASIVAAIVLCAVAQVGSFCLARGLYNLGKNKLEAASNVAPVIVLLALGLLLVSRYGAAGAAISLVVATLGGLLMRVLFFSRTRSIPTARVAHRSVAEVAA